MAGLLVQAASVRARIAIEPAAPPLMNFMVMRRLMSVNGSACKRRGQNLLVCRRSSGLATLWTT
jgi:hypothetical protein